MSHPWFLPFHRRALTLAVCAGWLVFELFQGEPFWLTVAGAATGYATWEFFLSGRYAVDPDKDAER